MQTIVVQPVGRTFERIARKVLNVVEETEDEKAGAKGKKGERDFSAFTNSKKKSSGGKLTEEEMKQNHYEILELGGKWKATSEEIKENYKRLILANHPDKTGGDATKFKQVQLAFEILDDPIKRRSFDSSVPFDDSVPSTSKVTAENFYKVFRPVFDRNARWNSSKKAAPSLGDESTPFEEVEAFYDFWFNFKSWRDFSFDDEFDPEQAESREERRWMERQNDRERERSKRDERKRILSLAETAYKLDPRVRARRASEKESREAEKNAKRIAAETKKREEEERAALELKQKEEADAKARAEHKSNAEQLKKQRQAFGKLTKPYLLDTIEISNTGIALNMVEFLRVKMDLAELVDFTDLLKSVLADSGSEPPPQEFFQLINEKVAMVESRCCENRFGKSLKDAKDKDKIVVEDKATVTWTSDEVNALHKATVKFPAGTRTRWERIAEYLGGVKSATQCLQKAKALEARLGAEVPIDQKFVAPNKKHREPDPKPDETVPEDSTPIVAVTICDRSGRAVKSSGSAKSSSSTSAAAAPLESTSDATAEPPQVDASSSTAQNPNEEALNWSQVQQKELENALREYKAYKEKDKWDKIAAKVEGKSKKQCILRFKFLAEKSKP